MRSRSIVARGLCWAAALLTTSSLLHPASAAPAKRHKPARAAKSAPKSAPAGSDDSAAKPDDAPTPAPDADAVKPADAAPQPEPTAPEKPAVPKTKLEQAPPVKAQLSLEPESEAVSNRDDEALGRREAARLAAGRTEVAVSVSIDVGSRHFKYSDPVGPLFAPYRLGIAPMASFGLEAYPLASTNLPGLRDLGFRGRFSRAFALDSKTPEGITIETSWTRFGGDVRERFLIPGSHPIELGVYVGMDASHFGMKTETPVAALLPTAKTISVRFGFDARLLVAGHFSVMLGAAYLLPTSRGEIYDRFRSPHVAGVDGELGAALGIIPGLEARLTGRYTRYFASFDPVVGDQIVAGGALDEQMQFGLGVRYAH